MLKIYHTELLKGITTLTKCRISYDHNTKQAKARCGIANQRQPPSVTLQRALVQSTDFRTAVVLFLVS